MEILMEKAKRPLEASSRVSLPSPFILIRDQRRPDINRRSKYNGC